MQTKEAIEFVLNTKGLTKYALAKSLGVAPVSVNQWLRGTRMSTAVAKRFRILYTIDIENTYDSVSAPKRTSTKDNLSIT